MALLDTLPEDASPVSVSQAGLIRLSGPARAIALDVLRVNSLQTGAYVSHFRGRGMEFDESRPYQPGDDPRSIDWRVTARSTTAYTKLFREERERPVLVVVDLRASMHFATRGCFKSVNASRAAALLSWAAHHRGDRLGGLIFGDTTHRELKPRLGRQAALRYVHELVGHPDWQNRESPVDDDYEAPLTQAMSALRRVARPGSLVVILSDFAGFSRLHSRICRASRATMKYWPFFSTIRSSETCRRPDVIAWYPVTTNSRSIRSRKLHAATTRRHSRRAVRNWRHSVIAMAST